jgi:hypothetical protein
MRPARRLYHSDGALVGWRSAALTALDEHSVASNLCLLRR